ncbi:MAG TPA: hypothetical protein VGE25_04455 [Sediminibacterium sp.]
MMKRLLIALLLLVQVARAQTFVSVRDWPMPAGYTSGLVTPGFRIVPKFFLENLGTKTYLILKMEITLASPRNPVAPYSYRYMRGGKIYTDRDLGFDPFYPIGLSAATFSVRVQGPGVNKQISYEWFLGRNQVAEVPKDTRVESYAAHIQGLTSVGYHGTDAMDRAITNFEAAIKKKEDDARRAEREKADADKKKIEDEKKQIEKEKADADKKKTEDEKKRAEAQRNGPSNGGNTGGGNTNGSDNNGSNSAAAKLAPFNSYPNGDPSIKPTATPNQNNNGKSGQSFWSEKKQEKGGPIPDQPIHKNLPDFVRTTDGGYFHRGEDGKFRQVTQQEYQDAKNAVAAKSQKPVEQEKPTLTAEEVRSQVNKMFADAEAQNRAINQQIEQKVEMWKQNYYYAEAIRNGKENLAALSSLNGSYNSVQELEAAFYQQSSAIRSEVQNLEQARNAKLSNAVNGNFNGNSTERAIGQSMQLIGGIINSSKAAKEEREAREALRAERERQLAAIAAAKIKARIGMRNQLLRSFPNGGTPLTSHKVVLPEVYMFAYLTDMSAFDKEQSVVAVSNVFPVKQYSDGTFPYKTSVISKLKGYAPGEVMLVGYYGEKDKAEQMRKAFVNLAAQSELTVRTFAIKAPPGTTTVASGASGDFWETGGKKNATDEKKTDKKSDFWNN